MKLAYQEYDIVINFEENIVPVITIEDKKTYLQFIYDMYSQINDGSGPFVLSENSKILKLEKESDILFEPFSLKINERKILSKLFYELEGLSIENMAKETIELNSHLENYMDKVCEQVPYNLCFKTEQMPENIFKLVDLKFEESSTTPLEKVIEYMGLVQQVCGTKLFILVNFKTFFEKEAMDGLYEYVFYNKINVILIENTYSEAEKDKEKNILIDRDKCIIEI